MGKDKRKLRNKGVVGEVWEESEVEEKWNGSGWELKRCEVRWKKVEFDGSKMR